VTSPDGLDLAALLRVFDANYFDVSNATDLPRETRNWLKELQQVRKPLGTPHWNKERPDDLFRDLDTSNAFSEQLEAKRRSSQRCETGRLWFGWSCQQQSAAPTPPAPASVATEFQQTQIVRLKSSSTEAGPILRILPGAPQNRYESS